VGIFFAFIGLAGAQVDGPESGRDPDVRPVAYELVFADEFDAGQSPSTAYWNIETGYGPNDDGWGNNEWQEYTDSPANVRVEGGNLVISAQCSAKSCGVRDGSITSGKITSRGKFAFRFGKVEARIKPPVGKGAWPAFWALGANHADVGWPRSGEMAFMEIHNFYSDDKTVHFMLHWCDETLQAPAPCSFPEGWVYVDQSTSLPASLGDDFHIFSTEWDSKKIVGKIDGVTYFSRAIDPASMDEFLKEFYLVLNVAMGGAVASGDQPPDGSEQYPQTMLVDYIRVYQAPGSGH
jgi:beta-glucanase (GH16 family)